MQDRGTSIAFLFGPQILLGPQEIISEFVSVDHLRRFQDAVLRDILLLMFHASVTRFSPFIFSIRTLMNLYFQFSYSRLLTSFGPLANITKTCRAVLLSHQSAYPRALPAWHNTANINC
jgi:hypothetical protein